MKTMGLDEFKSWLYEKRIRDYDSLSYKEKFSIALEYLGKGDSKEATVDAAELIHEYTMQKFTEAQIRTAIPTIMVRNKPSNMGQLVQDLYKQ